MFNNFQSFLDGPVDMEIFYGDSSLRSAIDIRVSEPSAKTKSQVPWMPQSGLSIHKQSIQEEAPSSVDGVDQAYILALQRSSDMSHHSKAISRDDVLRQKSQYTPRNRTFQTAQSPERNTLNQIQECDLLEEYTKEKKKSYRRSSSDKKGNREIEHILKEQIESSRSPDREESQIIKRSLLMESLPHEEFDSEEPIIKSFNNDQSKDYGNQSRYNQFQQTQFVKHESSEKRLLQFNKLVLSPGFQAANQRPNQFAEAQLEWKKQRDNKVELTKASLEQEFQEKIKPVGNKSSYQKYFSKKKFHDDDYYKSVMKKYQDQRRAHEQQKEKLDQIDENVYTFKPQISKASKAITARYERPKVEERLLLKGQEYKDKMKHKKEEMGATAVSKYFSKSSERYLLESSDFRMGLIGSTTQSAHVPERISKSPVKNLQIKTTVNQTYLYDMAKFKNEVYDQKKHDYLVEQAKMIQDRPKIDKNSKKMVQSNNDVHSRLYKNERPKKEESPPPEVESPPKFSKQQINNFLERNVTDSIKHKQLKIEQKKQKEEEDLQSLFQPKICGQSKEIVNKKGQNPSFEELYKEAKIILIRKRQYIEAEKKKREDAEMKDVTFQPQINKNKAYLNVTQVSQTHRVNSYSTLSKQFKKMPEQSSYLDQHFFKKNLEYLKQKEIEERKGNNEFQKINEFSKTMLEQLNQQKQEADSAFVALQEFDMVENFLKSLDVSKEEVPMPQKLPQTYSTMHMEQQQNDDLKIFYPTQPDYYQDPMLKTNESEPSSTDQRIINEARQAILDFERQFNGGPQIQIDEEEEQDVKLTPLAANQSQSIMVTTPQPAQNINMNHSQGFAPSSKNNSLLATKYIQRGMESTDSKIFNAESLERTPDTDLRKYSEVYSPDAIRGMGMGIGMEDSPSPTHNYINEPPGAKSKSNFEHYHPPQYDQQEYKSGGSQIQIEENSLEDDEENDDVPVVRTLPPSPNEEEYFTPQQQDEEQFKIDVKPLENLRQESLSLIEEAENEEDSAMSSVIASVMSPVHSERRKIKKQPALCREITQIEKKFIMFLSQIYD